MRKKLFFVVGLFVVGILVFTGFSVYKKQSLTNAAKKPAENFFSLYNKKDATGTYGIFTERLKAKITSPDWSNYVLSSKPYTGVTYAKTEPVVNPEGAYPKNSNPQKVIFNAKQENVSFVFTFVVLKEQEKWKIDEFNGRVK